MQQGCNQLTFSGCFWTWKCAARHHFPLLTNIPVVGVCLHLHLADNVPDAGHPVGQQGKHGHEQRQDHGAVLRVAVHFLEQPQQTEQTDRFQEVDHGHLGTKKTRWIPFWDADGRLINFMQLVVHTSTLYSYHLPVQDYISWRQDMFHSLIRNLQVLQLHDLLFISWDCLVFRWGQDQRDPCCVSHSLIVHTYTPSLLTCPWSYCQPSPGFPVPFQTVFVPHVFITFQLVSMVYDFAFFSGFWILACSLPGFVSLFQTDCPCVTAWLSSKDFAFWTSSLVSQVLLCIWASDLPGNVSVRHKHEDSET